MVVFPAAVLLSVVLLLIPVQAADLDYYRRAAAGIKSLKADFTQLKHLKILAKPLVSQGCLAYRLPDRLRWEYLTPVKSLMLMQRDKVGLFQFIQGRWAVDQAGGEQMKNALVGEIGLWLAGRFDETTGFKASLDPGPPNQVILIPREGLKSFISRVEITFSATPGVIEKVEIFEPAEALTRIEFTNVQVNLELDENLFEKP
ncbi:MAG: outer membrane lipoprotein carrier protein LolA [Thermodesulfobacteriota bacterium]